ncbi:MAG TPA: hypothetical protein VKV73_15605 [Chloroflexota bacterium]|nr:hypothetical protein [Chloroflexota bacterium]
MADDLVVVHGHILLAGVEVQVTQQRGRNMHGKAAVDGVGGEDPTQVVGSEDKRLAVHIAEPRISSRAIEQTDNARSPHDAMAAVLPALEQERQRWAEDLLVRIL